jgi:hypothetical protein
LDRFWSDFDALAQRSNAYLPALDITETRTRDSCNTYCAHCKET